MSVKNINKDQLCPCGSEQSFGNCCGATGLPLARYKSRKLDELSTEIRAMRDAGQRDEAYRQLKTLTHLATDHLPAWELLAEMQQRRNDHKGRSHSLAELSRLDPRNHVRHTHQADHHLKLREFKQAEAAARQALALNPHNPRAYYILGDIHVERFMPEDAEFYYRQVLLLHQPIPKLCISLGNCYKRMGRLREAEAFFRQAEYLEPGNADALLGWVRMEEARAQLDRAWEILNRVPQEKRSLPGVSIAASALHRRGKKLDDALQELDQLAERSPKIANNPTYLFERGEVLDARGDYDAAFDYFARGNTASSTAAKREYDSSKQQDRAARLKTVFTAENMAAIRANTVIDTLPQGVPQPLFIVGFPRSGTTLVEQMLTRHSNIAAGDELPYIWKLTDLARHMTGGGKSYPECLAENLIKPAQSRALRKFRAYYLANVEARNIVEPGKTRFTDKMPLNETNLGFIHLVFPEAPIVHLVRHPLDVVLSTFFHDLTHGGNMGYKLETAAAHYAMVFDLLQHYKSQLPLNYHAVRYEDLVDDPEANLRQLIGFLGEEWQEQCLNPHENQRYARTASYAQVKEKIYTRSRYRYRNYLKHLEPIIPILAPAMEKLGYEV